MPLVSVTAMSRERALAKLLPHNGVLAALPQDVRERLLPDLALVDLRAGHELGQADGSFARAYFPLDGIVSLTHSGTDGRERIGALVGREGAVGLPSFLNDAGVRHGLVQWSGYGLALGREPLLAEWGRGGAFMRVLARYSQAVSAQHVILDACRTHHRPEQQLASLLVMCLERASGGEVTLSLQAVAALLDIAPAQIADAAEQLRAAGALAMRPSGWIAAHDPVALARIGCGCAARVSSEYHRLLPPQPAPVLEPDPLVAAARVSELARTPSHPH